MDITAYIIVWGIFIPILLSKFSFLCAVPVTFTPVPAPVCPLLFRMVFTRSTTMKDNFKCRDLCGFCTKPVTNSQWALTCDACNHWIHVSTCSDESASRYSTRMKLREELEIGFVCRLCMPKFVRRELPFQNLTNPAFKTLLKPNKKPITVTQVEEYIFPFHSESDNVFNTTDSVKLSTNLLIYMPFHSLSNQQLMLTTGNRVNKDDLPQESIGFLGKSKKALNIVAMNCQGVRNKLSELRIIAAEGNISIFAITETWFTKSHKDSELQMDGYTMHRTDRLPKQWGTVLYTRQGLCVARLYEKMEIPSDVFKIVIKGQRPFILINNYRPCNSGQSWHTAYEKLLQMITDEYPGLNIYSMGDFNADLKNPSRETEKFCELMKTNGFDNLITKPTRIALNSSTLIDHFWTNERNAITHIDTFVGISDHFGIAASVNVGKIKCENQTVTYRDTKHFNPAKYAEDIANVPWQSCFIFDDLNDQYAHFCKLLDEIIDEHAPLKTVKLKPTKTNLPWITPEIKAIIKTKNLLSKQSRIDTTLLPLFKDIRRTVKKQLKNAENEYFDKELQKTNGNSRKMWHVLNKATGFRKSRGKCAGIKNKQNANEFNSFFSNVSSQVKNDLNNIVENFRIQPLKQNESEENVPLFNLRKSTDIDIHKIITMLDPSKSTGHDNIGCIFIRSASETLSGVISSLVNNAICSGEFPNEHKIAKVTPVYKKGEKSKPDNHRPVSILPVISKIFERFIVDRLCEHVEGNQLINLHQSGFRKHHGTHTALHHMIDKWTAALGQKQCVAVLAIDLSKAFDCLNHSSIFAALSRLGIQNCKVLEDYLHNRKQYVHCNGISSELEDILNGIPQGSILGPLLFILALSDIEKVIKSCLHMFADDITSWISGTNWCEIKIKLKETLQELFTYLAFKGLRINMGKCHLMIMGKQYLNLNEPNKPLKIELYDATVSEEREIKLLGVTIDNKLSFEKHVIELTEKCNRNIQFLWRTAKDRNEKHRFMLGNALVVSHLNYCDTVYHRFLTEKLSKMLNSVQYKLLRFMFGINSGQRVSLDTLCKRIGWLPLNKHRESKLLTLIWRIMHDEKLPPYMKTCIYINNNNRNTRFNSSSQAILNEYGRHALNSVYCKSYITLPFILNHFKNATVFMNRVQRFLE